MDHFKCMGKGRISMRLHHISKATVPQSSYPDPYIPALNNLWCHTENKQPGDKTRKVNIIITQLLCQIAYSEELYNNNIQILFTKYLH